MDELVDKDVKTANINILHIFEEIDKSMSMLRRDMDDTKKGQIDRISETKNTLDGINTLDTMEDKISELENRKQYFLYASYSQIYNFYSEF